MVAVYQLSEENTKILNRMNTFIEKIKKIPQGILIAAVFTEDLKFLEEAIYLEDSQHSFKGKDKRTSQQEKFIVEVDSVKNNIVALVDAVEKSIDNNNQNNDFIITFKGFEKKYQIEKQRLINLLNDQKVNDVKLKLSSSSSSSSSKADDTTTYDAKQKTTNNNNQAKKPAPKPNAGLGAHFLSSMKSFLSSLSDMTPNGEKNRLKAQYGIMGVVLNLITTFLGGLFKSFMAPKHHEDIDVIVKDAPVNILKGMGVTDDMIPDIKTEFDAKPTMVNKSTVVSDQTQDSYFDLGSSSKSQTYTPMMNHNNNNNNNNAPMSAFANAILQQAEKSATVQQTVQAASKGFFNQFVPGIVSGPAKFLYNTFVGNKPVVNPKEAWTSHFNFKQK